MKKKLLIIAGAGASIDFGFPSVDEVDSHFQKIAEPAYRLANDRTSNLYTYIRNAIERYYSNEHSQVVRKHVTYEDVLYQLNLLAPFLTDPSWQHGSNALLGSTILPQVRENGLAKTVDGYTLIRLSCTLLDSLVEYFVNRCNDFRSSGAKKLNHLKQFLSVLQKDFEIGVVTLNHDNLFTQAIPDLHTGFNSNGEFDPLTVLRREKWDFIYHLHGCVHFAMTESRSDIHHITWVGKPRVDGAVFASGRNNQGSTEGPGYPISIFVAGHGKPQQILRQPFRTYFAQVNRLVYEADAFLFLGYGFGDLHINAALSGIRSPARPVVVVDWASDSQDCLRFREDAWAHRLSTTVPYERNAMSEEGHCGAASVLNLKRTCELEVSNNPQCPLAVWYNGMLCACKNSQKILKHLTL